MKTFIARYEINDGYAGESRPQTFKITADELEDCTDTIDFEMLFEDRMQEAFSQRHAPYALNLAEFMTWAEKVLEEQSGD